MNVLKFGSLGETWINLVRLTIEAGASLDKEGYECLEVSVSFPADNSGDPLIEQLGDAQMIAEMQQVFFTESLNPLGHSYARLMRGPAGRADLGDVIELLRAQRWSKRGVVSLCGTGDGKVPCINTVQFLVRGDTVQTIYFSRGQDAYRKFYADALCLGRMAQTVAEGLALPAGTITGFIASSHVYYRDLTAIRDLLARASAVLAGPAPAGVL